MRARCRGAKSIGEEALPRRLCADRPRSGRPCPTDSQGNAGWTVETHVDGLEELLAPIEMTWGTADAPEWGLWRSRLRARGPPWASANGLRSAARRTCDL